MRFFSKERGASLATTLVIASLVLTLGFTVVGVGFHHLNASTRISNAQVAKDLAESALAKAIERIQEREASGGTPDYGVGGTETISIDTPGAPEGAVGIVSFDQSFLDVQDFRLERSLNNLSSDTAVPAGNGRVVPAEAVYLAAYGVCNGVERRVEAVLHVPRFPYSVASQGSIRGTDLLIAGIKEGAVIPRSGTPDPQDLTPGHLVTNSEAGTSALALRGQNLVKGDLQSASGVDLSAGNTKVEGETRTFAGSVTLPDVDVTSYAPDPDDPATNTSLSSLENNLRLEGTYLYDNPGTPLTVTGGLTLDGGVLYVNGDLVVLGGISGEGAVIATGSIEVRGGGSLSTDNLAALVAMGDISIDGQASTPASAMFEGLIYTEGNLRAENLTLVGVFVANNEGAEQTELRNVKVYEKPEHADISFTTTTTVTGSGGISSGTVTGPDIVDVFTDPDGGLGRGNQRDYHARIEGNYGTYRTPAAMVVALEAHFGVTLSSSEKTALENWIRQHGSGGYQLVFNSMADVSTAVTQGGGGSSTTTTSSTTTGLFSLNLSDFVSISDRMKILYWGEPQ